MSQLPTEQRQRIKNALGKFAQQRLPETDLWPTMREHAESVVPIIASDTITTQLPTSVQVNSRRVSYTTALASIAVMMVIGLFTYVLLPVFTTAFNTSGSAVANLAPVASSPAPAVTQPKPAPKLSAADYNAPSNYADPTDKRPLMTRTMSQLAQPISATQTISGYSLTIEKVYADSNIIVVRCSVTGPNSQGVNPKNTILSNGEHTNRADAAFSLFPKGQDPNLNHECAMRFDSSTLNIENDTITLHLATSLAFYCTGYNPAPECANTSPDPNNYLVVAGSFNFDFAVSIIPAKRIINVEQTVDAHGVAVTLKQIVITPGQTHVIVNFTPPSHTDYYWMPLIGIDGADWSTPNGNDYENPDMDKTVDHLSMGPYVKLADGSYDAPITANLYEKTGNWVLTVQELEGSNGDGVSEVTRVLGPWTFTINIPNN